MANNKIIFDGQVLIDLTADTVTPETMLRGTTAHDKSGANIIGTCDYDVNSQDATVSVDEILDSKTGYARGVKLTGRMPNNGAVTGSISTKDGQYTIPMGYHDGTGKVGLSATEKAKLKPENIAEGITLFGVGGTHKGGADEVKQAKTVTPTASQQVITPDAGYTCLSQVTVNGIPYTESPNSAGGTTVTIG